MEGIVQRLTLPQFMERFGRYETQHGLFHHRQIQRRLAHYGFRVVSINRDDCHPVWRVRLRNTIDAQLALLLTRKRWKGRGKAELLHRRLKQVLCEVLAEIGPRVEARDIDLMREGRYIQASFVWKAGRPGLWLPAVARPTPMQVSLTLLRWIREQRN